MHQTMSNIFQSSEAIQKLCVIVKNASLETEFEVCTTKMLYKSHFGPV